MANFRSTQGPEASRKMSRLIRTEGTVIDATETAGREHVSVAAQLSEWGETTDDGAISDISDKLGVMMAEIGDQEGIFSQNLEGHRNVLKEIRNMEGSVQPSRDYRSRIADEVRRLKYREPSNPRLVTLEQELVRAEAMNLVAEAQLTNVTRQSIKEAFDIHLAAVIERSEKQAILARHARRLLRFIDDSPVVPGDPPQEYKGEPDARQVLEDAEKEMRSWVKTVEPIPWAAGNGDTATVPTLRSTARKPRVTPVTAVRQRGTDGTASEAPKKEMGIEGHPEAEKEVARTSEAPEAQTAAPAS